MSRARTLITSAAAALGMAATLALGSWQLSRAHQKEALATAIAQQRALPPVGEQALLGGAQPASLHRPVRLRGRWIADRTVFLDNRQMAGRVGFYVTTPLQLADSGRVVLVQRGWAPRNFERREALPAVQTPAGEVEITGRIAPPPAKLYEFRGAASGPIRQNLDLPAHAAETGLPMQVDLSVLQTGAASDGLLRDWPDGGASGPEKNYGYAVQWWALSALIAILYVWFQFIHPRRRTRRPA